MSNQILKMPKRFLAMLLVLMMIVGMLPVSVFAETTDGEGTDTPPVTGTTPSTVTTTLDGKTLTVNEYFEFGVTTEPNDDEGKNVHGYFDCSDWSAVASLQYKEQDSKWYDLPAGTAFGPAGSGFPMSAATSVFQVKFSKAGTYTFGVSMKTADTQKTELCSCEGTVTVKNPAISDVTVTAKTDLVYTGADQELVTVTGVAGTDTVSYKINGTDTAKAEAKDAGSYEVTVTVKREGYEDLIKTVAVTIKKANQILIFNDTVPSSATIKMKEDGTGLEPITLDLSATATPPIADAEIKYAVKVPESGDAAEATIDAYGKLTVTKPGKLTVIASLAENSNGNAATSIKQELTVTAEKAAGEYVHFVKGETKEPVTDVFYTVGAFNGGVSGDVHAEKTIAEDEGEITYSIAYKTNEGTKDGTDIGLKIDAKNGGVAVVNYTNLVAAVAEAYNAGAEHLIVTVKAAKTADAMGEVAQYPADEATYKVYITLEKTPENPVTEADSKNDDGWYKEKVTVTPAEGYTIVKEITTTAEGFDTEVVFEDQGAFNRIVYLRNTATGGITDKIPVALNIDTEAPNAENISVEYSKDYNNIFEKVAFYYNTGVKVTVTVKDELGEEESGLAYINWSYVRAVNASESNLEKIDGKFESKDITKDEEKGYTATLTLTPEDYGQLHGSISFVAVDVAGNESASYAAAETFTDKDGEKQQIEAIVIDTISPTMTAQHTPKDIKTTKYNAVEVNGVTQHYYNGDVEFIFTVEEANFDANKVAIGVTKDGEVCDDDDVTVDWFNDETNKDIHYGKFTLLDEGDYVVTMSYTDRSGNTMEGKDISNGTIDTKTNSNDDSKINVYTSEVITVDKTPPKINIEYVEKDGDNLVMTATITVEEHNFRPSEMSIQYDAKYSDYLKEKPEDKGNMLEGILQDPENWTSVGDVHTLKLEALGESKVLIPAVYKMNIGYEDLAKNTDAKDYEFTVDCEAPKKVEITYGDSDDRIFPSGDGDEIALGFYKSGVTLTITSSDEVSGVASFQWKYMREGICETIVEEYQEGTISGKDIEIVDGEATATIKLPVNNGEQLRGKIVVTATDVVGNTTAEASATHTMVIDTSAPEVSIAELGYDNIVNEEVFYQKSATVQITVKEANFYAEDTVITVTKNGTEITTPEVTWTAATWTEGESRENDPIANGTYIGTFILREEGHYEVSVTHQDKSNNYVTEEDKVTEGPVSEATSRKITIDHRNPQIRVSYDNNTLAEGAEDGYFNAARTATIEITEHNFPMKNGEVDTEYVKINIPSSAKIVNWEHRGDTHTATIAYAEDADYTFDISVTDLAKRTNNPVDYMGSQNPNEFVVDTTYEDMITVKGVVNKSAYGPDEEGKFSIKIEDINLKPEKIVVTLKGVKCDESGNMQVIPVDEELKLKQDENNANLYEAEFDLFKKEKQFDGFYTLYVESWDKAGNKDEETISFTINRFGSVYVFEEYLKDLTEDGGTFVQEVEQDLVINEYNADQLEVGSLKIEITRDGKPLDNVQFDATPDFSEAERSKDGWYQYKYTISKSNFEEDGVYKISVSSKDGAGNTPENAGATFYVDSTKAEITSIVGLEEDIINAQEVNVKYTVFDTMGLKSIKVYVNGSVVSEITDFSADANNYSGSFTVTEDSSAQTVQIVVEDMAGNITDTNAGDFAPAYEFNSTVTISTNFFVRWYANTGLFWGSIAGIVVLIAVVAFIISKKKKTAVK